MKTLFLTFVAVSTSAFAASPSMLKCEREARPVDGNYESFELVRNDAGKYDLYFHRITSGFGAAESDKRTLIASNFNRCAFAAGDERLFHCQKSSSEEGEPTNSGFVSKLVSETSVVDSKGKTNTASFVELTAYSPTLAAGGEHLPSMERPGWVVVRFDAKYRPGLMKNGCIVTP